jgi:hypothetical protein
MRDMKIGFRYYACMLQESGEMVVTDVYKEEVDGPIVDSIGNAIKGQILVVKTNEEICTMMRETYTRVSQQDIMILLGIHSQQLEGGG